LVKSVCTDKDKRRAQDRYRTPESRKLELKEFLRKTYMEKRTLDFHANQLKQNKKKKNENVSESIQRIQALGSKFRESALLNCKMDEQAGIFTLSK
jgi:predicted transcriptional regulator